MHVACQRNCCRRRKSEKETEANWGCIPHCTAFKVGLPMELIIKSAENKVLAVQRSDSSQIEALSLAAQLHKHNVSVSGVPS